MTKQILYQYIETEFPDNADMKMLADYVVDQCYKHQNLEDFLQNPNTTQDKWLDYQTSDNVELPKQSLQRYQAMQKTVFKPDRVIQPEILNEVWPIKSIKEYNNQLDAFYKQDFQINGYKNECNYALRNSRVESVYYWSELHQLGIQVCSFVVNKQTQWFVTQCNYNRKDFRVQDYPYKRINEYLNVFDYIVQPQLHKYEDYLAYFTSDDMHCNALRNLLMLLARDSLRYHSMQIDEDRYTPTVFDLNNMLQEHCHRLLIECQQYLKERQAKERVPLLL